MVFSITLSLWFIMGYVYNIITTYLQATIISKWLATTIIVCVIYHYFVLGGIELVMDNPINTSSIIVIT